MHAASRQLCGLVLLVCCPMVAVAQTTPPLLPGEVEVKTKSGCAVVLVEASYATPEAFEKDKVGFSQFLWTGKCEYGLLNGIGIFAEAKNMDALRKAKWEDEFSFGRRIGVTKTYMSAWNEAPVSVATVTYRIGSRAVVTNSLANPYRPVWGDVWTLQGGKRQYSTHLRVVGGQSVSANTNSCQLDAVRFEGCGSPNDFPVYSIDVATAGGGAATTFWCPNPRTTAGCESLWEEKAGQVIGEIKAFVERATQKNEDDRRKFSELIQRWVESERANQLAREAEAKRLAAIEAAEQEKQRLRLAQEQRERELAAAKEEEMRVASAAAAKAKADKAFRANIAKLNAGELFVLATKLDREGNADNALEARSALVSRFPNHALAATAAQQMAAATTGASQPVGNAAGATSSAPSSPTKSAAASSASPPKYPSVCERNLSKLNNLVYDRKIRQAGALYDLFLRDYNLDGAKVLEPCIGTSASAARTYKAAMDEANRITQYCSGPHDKRLECRQWGNGASENQGNPYDNRAWYTGWKADVDRALADPQNFSAELGTAAGANTATASTTDAAADRCAAKLKTVEASFNAAQPNIPKNSVVVLSEATMWMLTESINIIESTCPNSVSYRGLAAQFRQTLAQTKQVCDRSSTRPCIAQLPGRAAAPPPPQAASPLKPLENKPPTSCEPSSSTGLSFTSCAREACESGGGSFAIGSTGCAGCTRAGGSWTLCPKGSGGVNSAQ